MSVRAVRALTLPTNGIVITRMRHDQATRDYVARRLAEGKTMGEIARILKRYVAREVFKHLPHPA